MSTSVETAKDLLTFAGGPSMLGTVALLAYTRKVFEGSERRAAAGWTALGAGLLLVVWLVVFILWAAPTVFGSWRSDGPADVTLVMLSVTWSIAIGFVSLLLFRSPVAARFLTEAYRSGEGPWLVRMLRKVLCR